MVEAPAFQEVRQAPSDGETHAIHAESSAGPDAEALREVLLDELHDLLHAEKQLLKALPKMVKAARAQKLQLLFDQHLMETQEQVERLNECFRILEVPARAKPCKGMMGLLEEGEEIIKKGEKKDDVPSDLSLIGAAQKVEHYEMSGYLCARNLAQQLHMSAIVQLLSVSLAEEQNADQLLYQVSRTLMSSPTMPARIT